MKSFLLFLLFWVLSGVIYFIHFTIDDIRGEEYDPDYFEGDFVKYFFVSIIIGYFGLPIILIEKEIIQKTIYKLYNIGYKEDNFNMPNRKHKKDEEDA